MNAELKQKMTREALKLKEATKIATNEEIIHSLATDVTVADADHSFNGIVFDIMAKDSYEIDITSISIGGMLGRVVSIQYFVTFIIFH